MKQYVLLILASVCFFNVKAQEMESLFIRMPDNQISQLETAWRKDLVDLYKSKKEAKLQNTMTGSSTLFNLTSNYLLLRSSERSTVEMKLLPLVNNTHLICMITTVEGSVSDSRMEFFTTEWQPLTVSDMFTPISTDWFLKGDADKSSDAYQDAISRLDMDLVKYQLNPDETTLTAVYTTPAYLSKEDQTKISAYIKESPKVYSWNKSRFE